MRDSQKGSFTLKYKFGTCSGRFFTTVMCECERMHTIHGAQKLCGSQAWKPETA